MAALPAWTECGYRALVCEKSCQGKNCQPMSGECEIAELNPGVARVAAPVPLEDQIACVERELAMRRNVYPRWVKQGKLSQTNADIEMRRMEAVLATLRGLPR